MDGEIVIIDGEAYHFTSKTTRKLGGSETLPFAILTHFRPVWEAMVPNVTSDSLSRRLSPFLPSKQNCFLSIRVDGFFDSVTFRIIAPQERDSEAPLDLVKSQKLSSYAGVQGTLFGFRSPEFVGAFTYAGYHLHFISDDRTMGGHVMNFYASSATIFVSVIDEYNVELPQSPEFNGFALHTPEEADVTTVESTF
jgi:alpha-acetolactate decarboxylase